MKNVFLIFIAFSMISCENDKVYLKGSKTQEHFINFVYKEYPFGVVNDIQKSEKEKIFNKKIKQYVYDSLKNIDGFLMKIKKINLQQFKYNKQIDIILVDYQNHLLDVDYHDTNVIRKNDKDSLSVLYRCFIDKKLNDYVFVYGKLDTILTFYKGFQKEDYKINIDSVQLVNSININNGKRDEIYH
jgi:hypothetical protein